MSPIEQQGLITDTFLSKRFAGEMRVVNVTQAQSNTATVVRYGTLTNDLLQR